MTIFIAAEDHLSRAVAKRLVLEFVGRQVDARELGMRYGGNAHIRRSMMNYVDLASRETVVVLTDLDNIECAPSLRRTWFDEAHIGDNTPRRLVFCIAVREIEAWLLADRVGFAEFLGIDPNVIARDLEAGLRDPKRHLVQLVRRCKKKSIRDDIVPERRNNAKVGLGYNDRLICYVLQL
jgi:hypothetical protein